MKLTEFFREEIDREVERSRKALEQVPSGQYDWKPHECSRADDDLLAADGPESARTFWPIR